MQQSSAFKMRYNNTNPFDRERKLRRFQQTIEEAKKDSNDDGTVTTQQPSKTVASGIRANNTYPFSC